MRLFIEYANFVFAKKPPKLGLKSIYVSLNEQAKSRLVNKLKYN